MLRAPDFATPMFCSFESVKPRPEVCESKSAMHVYYAPRFRLQFDMYLPLMQAPAYYDYKEVMDSDEELDYSAMDQD